MRNLFILFAFSLFFSCGSREDEVKSPQVQYPTSEIPVEYKKVWKVVKIKRSFDTYFGENYNGYSIKFNSDNTIEFTDASRTFKGQATVHSNRNFSFPYKDGTEIWMSVNTENSFTYFKIWFVKRTDGAMIDVELMAN